MGKKITNVVLFLVVVAALIGMTVYAGQGAFGVLVYNFVFLGIMIIIYLAGMFGGMFKMNSLGEAMEQAGDELGGIFKTAGKAAADKLNFLNGIFANKYLDQKMDNFTSTVSQSEEGLCEIEEYFNEEELDIHIHKRLLEMIPDIFTSLGILGTFIGLVWGLKNFDPNNYEAMTTSVSSLVEGIKVAFLTSIYGIALSIIYTYGMKTEYSYMTEKLQSFLEKFHALVMPTAENESRNLLLASQKNQAAAMHKMAEQFSVQMADSFEKVITPTFSKMNESLDSLVTAVTTCQRDAVKEIVDVFLDEMHASFKMQFSDFNEALVQMKHAQADNIEYTINLYQTLGRQMNESYVKQERIMRDLVEEMSGMQKDYMKTANKLIQDNQVIQKQQQEDYQRIADYLREAEKSSAKFWVACNQTMQKYVEAAAQSMEKVGSTGQVSAEVLKANKRVIETFDVKMQEFVDYQKLAYKTMDEVRRLLNDVSVVKENNDIYLVGGSSGTGESETLEHVAELLEAQNERQQALLEDMAKNIRDLSKNAQKGKFSLFR